MKLTPQQHKEIIEEAKEKGKFTIAGIGLFYVKPRRKGKIHGTFGSTPRYQKRILLLCYDSFKKQISEINYDVPIGLE